jgi:hypothetical protein
MAADEHDKPRELSKLQRDPEAMHEVKNIVL